jgi:hypothetical protein
VCVRGASPPRTHPASRQDTLEKHIDARLRTGSLNVTTTWRKKQYSWGGGVTMSEEQIEQHKKSGLYHAMLCSTGALVPVVPNPRLHVEHYYPLWQAEVSEHIRRCSTSFGIHACLAPDVAGSIECRTILAKGTHVRSWPEAAPHEHVFFFEPGELPYADGVFSLCLVRLVTITERDADDDTVPTIIVLETSVAAPADAQLKLVLTVSSGGGSGRRGTLTARLLPSTSSSSASAVTSTSIDVSAKGVTDSKEQTLCDWIEFRSRTNNGLSRYRLCSLQKLTDLKSYRETTLDANEEMQHESRVL